METTSVPTESPAMPPTNKKRKVSTAGRKAISDAAKARWAAKKALPSGVDRVDYYRKNPDGTYARIKGGIGNEPEIPHDSAPTISVPTPPSVLKLQEQVVELVAQRQQARRLLNEAHALYMDAQGRFQQAESVLKGIEQEVQYRIGLIAQLENRAPASSPVFTAMPDTAPSIFPSGATITSEAAPANQRRESFAVTSADDLRREMRTMM